MTARFGCRWLLLLLLCSSVLLPACRQPEGWPAPPRGYCCSRRPRQQRAPGRPAGYLAPPRTCGCSHNARRPSITPRMAPSRRWRRRATAHPYASTTPHDCGISAWTRLAIESPCGRHTTASRPAPPASPCGPWVRLRFPVIRPGLFWSIAPYTFTASGIVQSMPLSPPPVPVLAARLQVDDFWGVSGRIRYDLSHDGGAHWVPVEPGEWAHFAGSGTDLRWRATLLSTDLATTPMIEALSLTYTTAKPEG